MRNYYNLTHPQKRIWYIDKMNLNSPLHNIGGCLKINEKIDIEKMEESINFIIKSNEGLRLRFTENDGQPVQYIYDFEKENIDFVDFSDYKNPREEQQRWSQKVLKKSFILEDNKLYNFCIYKISEGEYGVLLNIHHIIADGWSISLIERQICEIYSSVRNEKEIKPQKYYSYINFIDQENKYLSSDRFIKNKEFWKEKFSGVPEDFLYKTFNSLEGKRQSFNVDNDLFKEIKKFIDEKNCSLNTFFISMLLIYINKTTCKRDLSIGIPVFNRSGIEQKSMVGMFTSTMPFRFDLNDEIAIKDFVKLINRELKYYFLNQKYPYDLLVKDLELSKKGYDNLFRICVNYYNFRYVESFDGIDVEVQEGYCGEQSYSLQLTIKEWEGDTIDLNFDYKVDEYSEQEIQVMYNSIINIIKQILKNENIQVRDIVLLSEEEINYKIYELNSTASTYPIKTVCELFEEQVLKTPDKMALEFKQIYLTYGELNEKSNQIANYLIQNGIKEESIVGIMLTHSIELIISILGVLKAGGTYLPIDPNYPIERINYMLEDSESIMLLTNFNIEDNIRFTGNITNINNINFNLYDKENLTQISGLKNLAYIIYTSGSTGRPKGVMIENQSITNYIWWAKKMYLKDKDEAMPLYSSISFDLTVTSIFIPLISGNKIVIYENDDTEFVLYKILRENKVSVVKLTPAHLMLLNEMDNRNSNIKRFIVGGENLKVSLARDVYESFDKNIEIYNEYGPTETAVGCMIYKYSKENDRGVSVPIGLPADNVQVYILDNNLNVLPTGLEGELYISGDGVARGYLNREELTNERFIKNPFIKGKKMYRTGDISKYLPNGDIEYVGRNDNQVKIRGYRIEIGEIEKYLLKNESIKDAVVVVKENSLGTKFINAYIVGNSNLTDSELKKWLLRFLPNYMIPSNFVLIDEVPLTLNGKVNYSLLPNNEVVKREFVEYTTDSEKVLINAMEEILGVKNISMNDNFYYLGGDSIKAIQVVSKVKECGYKISVRNILSNPIFEEMAVYVDNFNEKVAKEYKMISGVIRKMPITEWFFSQNFDDVNFYNQSVMLEFKEKVSVSDIQIIFNKIISQHDALRINYSSEKKELYYNDSYLKDDNKIQFFDLSCYSKLDREKKIMEIIDGIKTNINIQDTRLFQAAFFETGYTNKLFLTAHHLCIDGVSWRIILDDLYVMLKQIKESKDILLGAKTDSVQKWAEALWNYSNKLREFNEIDYWKSILDESNDLFDSYINKGIISNKRTIICESMSENDTINLLSNSNISYNTETKHLLICALVVTISEILHKDKIVIQLEGHGREELSEDNIDVSRTVGWFTSIFPVLFNINSSDLSENIKGVKETIKNIPNNGLGFGIYKYLLNSFEKSCKGLISFNYLGDFSNYSENDLFKLYDNTIKDDYAESNHMTCLIDINCYVINNVLKIKLTYESGKFNDNFIVAFLRGYRENILNIINHCSNTDDSQFTPSDFETVEITQDDLDSLFI